MTEEQRHIFYRMCIDYRTAPAGEAHGPYLALLYHVETLIDEAVKDAINLTRSRVVELESALYTIGQDLEQLGLDTSDIEEALGGSEGIARVEGAINSHMADKE